MAALALLYKYRNWTQEADFKFVTDVIAGKLWFPVATAVNDPFEFRCAVNFLLDPEATIQAFIQVELSKNPGSSRLAAEQKVRNVFARVPRFKVKERQWELSLNLWRGLASSVSMCSLSGTPVSNLLWSHYAGGHTGVAVEIDPIDLRKFLYEVIYDDGMPTIDPFCLVDIRAALGANIFSTLFLKKAKCWEYEREYRIMIMRADSHAEKLRPGSVKRVILGCAMPPEKRISLLDWIKNNAPDVPIAYALPEEDKGYNLRIVEDL